MKINKILNNNYVTSYNDDTGEIVVMGPGVGFRKKAGNTIDSNKIEKIFYLPIGREMDINQSIHYKLARNIVKMASVKWNTLFYNEVIGMIASYLSFVLNTRENNKKLFQNKAMNTRIENDFESEIMQYIYEKINIKLTKTEIKYILHCLKNYSFFEEKEDDQVGTLVNEIMYIVEKTYNIKLEENSEKYIIFKNNIMSLSREIVKLINQSIKVHQESKFTNDSKSNMCTNIINKYIREKYQYNLSIEEMKFLNDNIESMSIN